MYALLDEATIPGLQRSLTKWDPGAGWVVRYDDVAKLWSAATEDGHRLPTTHSIEEAAVFWCRILAGKHGIKTRLLPAEVI